MNQTTALKLLKLGENVFITGYVGTGKTHTVLHIYGRLQLELFFLILLE